MIALTTYLPEVSPLSTQTGLALLREVIEQEQSSLSRYAARPGAKQGYLDFRNRQNEKLIRVYNAFSQSRFLPIWLRAERQMERLEALDPTLSGFHLRLQLREGSGFYGQINLNELSHDAA